MWDRLGQGRQHLDLAAAGQRPGQGGRLVQSLEHPDGPGSRLEGVTLPRPVPVAAGQLSQHVGQQRAVAEPLEPAPRALEQGDGLVDLVQPQVCLAELQLDAAAVVVVSRQVERPAQVRPGGLSGRPTHGGGTGGDQRVERPCADRGVVLAAVHRLRVMVRDQVGHLQAAI